MRALAYLKKTFLENLREWKVLSLALVFAPAFVYMMYGYYGAATPAYRLLVVNHDTRDADGAPGAESKALLSAWRQAKHPDGKPVFTVIEQPDLEAARVQVRARDADLLVEIPAGFTAAVSSQGSAQPAAPARLKNHADERNLRSSMAMAMSDYVAFTQVATRTGAHLPLDVTVASLGSGRPARWYSDYTTTYVERDVRQPLNVPDLEAFSTFLRLCAGRSAQELVLVYGGERATQRRETRVVPWNKLHDVCWTDDDR